MTMPALFLVALAFHLCSPSPQLFDGTTASQIKRIAGGALCPEIQFQFEKLIGLTTDCQSTPPS